MQSGWLGCILPYHGSLYVPGACWRRINSETFAEEMLVPGRLPLKYSIWPFDASPKEVFPVERSELETLEEEGVRMADHASPQHAAALVALMNVHQLEHLITFNTLDFDGSGVSVVSPGEIAGS